MHRLLSLNITTVRNFPSVLNRLKVGNSTSLRPQPSLIFPGINSICQTCARFRSTTTNPSLVITKKTRKRRKKNYSEVLSVTSSSAKQQRAPVRKLTGEDLKILASGDLSLSELYKLKDYVGSSNDKDSEKTVIIGDIPHLRGPSSEPAKEPSSEPAESEDLTEEAFADLLVEVPIQKVFHPAIDSEDCLEASPEASEESGIFSNSKEKDNLKEEHTYFLACKNLGAFIEVSCQNGRPESGLAALIYHNHLAQTRKGKEHLIMKDINVYNALLKGFAIKGNELKLNQVVRIIKGLHVKLNIQSYIAIIECFSRINKNNNIKNYLAEAVREGYNFNKILNYGSFLRDQRELVLKAMLAINPNFVPKYYLPHLQYSNHLVEKLNDDQQLKEPELAKCMANDKGIFSAEFMKNALKEQMAAEINGSVEVQNIAARPEQITPKVLQYRKSLNDHYKKWELDASNAYTLNVASQVARKGSFNIEPYLRCILLKDYVKIIVEKAIEITEGSESYSPWVTHIQRDLGAKVYAKYVISHKKRSGVLDKIEHIHSQYCHAYASKRDQPGVVPDANEIPILNPRQQWQWSEHSAKSTGATLNMDHREWNLGIFETVGEFLLRIIINDLRFDDNWTRSSNNGEHNWIPAFYKVNRNEYRKVVNEIKPHPKLSQLRRAALPPTLAFQSSEVPMRCPPVPWTNLTNGGYLVTPSDLVRMPHYAVLQKKRLRETPAQKLYPSFDSLNQLSSVPWKINTDVLDVLIEVFRNGGSDRLDVPRPSSSLEPWKKPTDITDESERKNKEKQLAAEHRKKQKEMHSLYCDCLYRLSLANHFRNDVFWLPHNMDFRGRVYPIPPHLNHLGSDLARSVLMFAESRPLGKDGLRWLKIHLINLTGLMKRGSLDDRLAYADRLLPDILGSAERPLQHHWWTHSEEPWQTLACCMEIAKALNSPDPEKFLSCFPVHQDGSCNGLQHYAALGRDRVGAKSVNLSPSWLPQDVYSAVVALVEEQRYQDAANGDEVAILLDGVIKRKVIKQTIMTTVYGVTPFGARLQIAKQLKDVDGFPQTEVWKASRYLTVSTLKSLQSMFTSTKEIQDWLTLCARQIAGLTEKHVEWITPLDLPVVQPYVKKAKTKPPSVFGTQKVMYRPIPMDQYERPNRMKHKNAFAPNFIHSLDSSHMMLTSLYCERAGISFVSVHDCYWTHPSTVDIMNKICREQFVALHSYPILPNLSEFFYDKFAFNESAFCDDNKKIDEQTNFNELLRKLPPTGDFDITEVLESVYFFS